MAIEKLVNHSILRLTIGDITDIEIDAFVYYARKDLVLGTGFGTAISNRGGSAIQKELEQIGPLGIGEAVVTCGGNLKANHIIHAVGPKFQEENLEEKFRNTIRSAMEKAEEKGIERIAFPAMGAGFYGVPLELCARLMVDVIKHYLEGETKIKEVVLCVIDSREYEAFKPVIEEI